MELNSDVAEIIIVYNFSIKTKCDWMIYICAMSPLPIKWHCVHASIMPYVLHRNDRTFTFLIYFCSRNPVSAPIAAVLFCDKPIIPNGSEPKNWGCENVWHKCLRARICVYISKFVFIWLFCLSSFCIWMESFESEEVSDNALNDTINFIKPSIKTWIHSNGVECVLFSVSRSRREQRKKNWIHSNAECSLRLHNNNNN